MKDQAAFLDILSRPRPEDQRGVQPPRPGSRRPLGGLPSAPDRPRTAPREAVPEAAQGAEGAERASPGAPAVRGQPGAAAAAAGSQRGEPAASPASSPAGRIGRMTGGGPSRTVPSRGRSGAGSERPKPQNGDRPNKQRQHGAPVRPRGGYPTGARRSRWQHGGRQLGRRAAPADIC